MGPKSKRLTNIQAGRPPTAKPRRAMSRRASRAVINRHHQLEKTRRLAGERGDAAAAAAATAELASLGGLRRYQEASLQGQSVERGGDTSRVLVEWLPTGRDPGPWRRLRMLEVGALSTRNACSVSGLFDMVRIDLGSREAGILQQDFMQRPLPESEADRFDVISLSLVLNYVSDAAARGRMLARSLSFLRRFDGEAPSDITNTVTASALPCLFLVLPRSCVTNSRYFTATRLKELMDMLGYALVNDKMTQKLAYSLWTRRRDVATAHVTLPKTEINPGRDRNNFAITLDSSATIETSGPEKNL
ncbi:hypothetical protein L249_5333 [Ophiocordyceps polyrhachis-furcata BCC 54312]|uniref:25S rRNA adenine-N(1) methyltransferase n=1 Tax=Ophiocordyceps polyrhachis-furcata BCC 54312 TaxID=1330021 RepID=A0A367L921_9HYPO|nr:hypothetical protein L249_5333 [Ophiocordyceps polyrhachis-furcata BCC 54312]